MYAFCLHKLHADPAFFLTLHLGMSFEQAFGASLCEIVINKDLPRRIDIQFPDHKVTLIGHQHPSGRDGEGIELYLWKLLGGEYLKANRPKDLAEIKKKIDRYLKKDSVALKYWREDRLVLERELERGEYKSSNIEYSPEMLMWMKENNRRLFVNGQIFLHKLGYSDEEVEDILLFALTPSFYLANKKPELFRSVEAGTAEPSASAATAYDLSSCPRGDREDKDSSSVNDSFLEDFLKSLAKRMSVTSAINRFKKGSEAVGKLFFPQSTEFRLTDTTLDEAFEIFVKASQLNLNKTESQQLRQWLETGIAEAEQVQVHKVIENIPRDIENYKGCWGRDALIAAHLSYTPSSITFIGANHLAPIASLLRKVCQPSLPTSQEPPKTAN